MISPHRKLIESSYISLARSLINFSDFNAIKKLLDFCPSAESNGSYRLDNQAQCAVMALALFLIESNLKFLDKILPYLLSVQKKLYKCYISDDIVCSDAQKLPQSECFSYMLSCSLSQVALMDPSRSDLIITTILDCANSILDEIDDLCQQPSDRFVAVTSVRRQHHTGSAAADESKVQLAIERVCLYLFPALLGIYRGTARGLRRIGSLQQTNKCPVSIVSYLVQPPCTYQQPSQPFQDHKESPQSRLEFISTIFPTFQCIIPHSLRHSLHFEYNDESMVTDNLMLPDKRGNHFMPNNPWLNAGGSEYLFGQVASVYASRLPHRTIFCNNSSAAFPSVDVTSHFGPVEDGGHDVAIVLFSHNQLRILIKMAYQLINERFCKRLDLIANIFWPYRPKNGQYPYRSFSHCLRLCCLLLVRDVCCNPKQDVSDKFNCNLQNLMHEVYNLCMQDVTLLSAELTGVRPPQQSTTKSSQTITTKINKRDSVGIHNGSNKHSPANSVISNSKFTSVAKFSNSIDDSEENDIDEADVDNHSSNSKLAFNNAVDELSNTDAIPLRSLNGTRNINKFDASANRRSDLSETASNKISTPKYNHTLSTPVENLTSQHVAPNKATSSTEFSPYTIFIFDFLTATTSTCIEILTKLVKEMPDSESLLMRLQERVYIGIDLKFMARSDQILDKSNTSTSPSLSGARNFGEKANHTNNNKLQPALFNAHTKSATCLQSPSSFIIKSSQSGGRARFSYLICNVGLLVVVLESVGQLTQRFPHLAKISLDTLVDFLLNPNHVLSRLNYQLDRLNNSKIEMTNLINTLRQSNSHTSLIGYKSNLTELARIKRLITYYGHLLEHIRGAAIQSLCRILLVNPNFVESFLADVSCRIFNAAESDRDTNLMYLNAVYCLGHMGVELVQLPRMQELILQFLQQNLNPTKLIPELEIKSMEQLGCMVITGSDEFHDQIMDILTAIRLRGTRELAMHPQTNNSRLRLLSQAVINVFANISNFLPGQDKLHCLLHRLLEQYAHVDVEMDQESKTNLAKNTAHGLGQLLPILAIVLHRLPVMKTPSQRLQKLFRNFWLYITVFGFTDPNSSVWPPEYFRAVCEIAAKSPVLLSRESLRSELQQTSALTARTLSQTDVTDLRNKLCALLDNNTETTALINRMSTGQCVYLLAVYSLESLCIAHSPDPEAFHRLFMYLEDSVIIKDKFGIWTCMSQIAVRTFTKYLAHMKTKPLDNERERVMDMHAQYLLVMFTRRHKSLRIVADEFLTMLAKDFPHVMWSGRVLHSMLDVSQLLSKSLTEDANHVAPVYTVPGTNFQIITADDLLAREKMLTDFVKRCIGIIEVGLHWSPSLLRSHLINYMLQLQHPAIDLAQHTGLALATESVLTFAGYNRSASFLGPNTLDKRPTCAKMDSSNFMYNLILRNRYIGEVSGMLYSCDDAIKIVKRLTADFDIACKEAWHYHVVLENAQHTRSTSFMSTDQTEIESQMKHVQNIQAHLSHSMNTVQACLFRMTALLIIHRSQPVLVSDLSGDLAEIDQPDDSVDTDVGDEVLNATNSKSHHSHLHKGALVMKRFFKSQKTSLVTLQHNFKNLIPTAESLNTSTPRNSKLLADSFIPTEEHIPPPIEPTGFVIQSDTARYLLREITHAPLKLFTTEMLENSIACWQWLVVGRPNLTNQLLIELSDAWQAAIHKRMGVFAVSPADDGELNPLIVSDELKHTPTTCDGGPHYLWAQFLSERLYVAQSSSQEQLDIIFDLLQKTLHGEITKLDSCIRHLPVKKPSLFANYFSDSSVCARLSTNVSALGVRCKLVEMCLSLLQRTGCQKSSLNGSVTEELLNNATGADSSAASVASATAGGSDGSGQQVMGPGHQLALARISLRLKAYAAVFNYFSVKPQYPAQKGVELSDELKALSRLWSLMQSERKYLNDGMAQIEQSALLGAVGRDLNFSLIQPWQHRMSTSIENNTYHHSVSSANPSTMTMFPVSPATYCPSNSSPNMRRINSHSMLNSPTKSGSTLPRLRSQVMLINDPATERSVVGSLILPTAVNTTPTTIQHASTLPGTNVAQSVVSKRSSTTGGKQVNRNNGDGHLKQLFLQKREIILILLASEIERLSVWFNPHGLMDLADLKDAQVETWLRETVRKKSWRRWIKFAWKVCPPVAVYMPQRFTGSDELRREVSTLVTSSPELVTHLPAALQYLVTSSNIEEGRPELTHMLTWAPVSPVMALSFFSRMFPQHPLTHQYAVRVLAEYSTQIMLFYVPQFIQGIRYDKLGYLAESILSFAKRSPLLAHQFLWNMKTNIYRDEEGTKFDSEIGNQLLTMSGAIQQNFSRPAFAFFQREFDFFDQVTSVSAKIKPYPKGEARRSACLEALRHITVKPGCYLPSNPDALVLAIDYKSGIPLQSAAKAPFLAKFKVRRVGVHNLEAEAMAATMNELPTNNNLLSVHHESTDGINMAGNPTTRSKRRSSCDIQRSNSSKHNRKQKVERTESKKSDNIVMQASIFKVGDDVRQDILALQVLQIIQNILDHSGIESFLYPYKVVATAPGRGVIECVPDSKSRDQIGRQTDGKLYEYFLSVYGDENSTSFQMARKNFVISLAAYSVFCYLMQIKDRHNANIMVDKYGHIIHIDFGFMLESSPGGNLGWETDIKLTKEMLMIMGGRVDSPTYLWFERLSIQAYLSLRPYQEAIVALISLMLDTGLPCFRGQTIKLMRQRFALQMTDREAAAAYARTIRSCVTNWRGKSYDVLQYVQNQIPY